MERSHFLARGRAGSRSSSGSHTLSEGEEATHVLVDIRVLGVGDDGDDAQNLEFEGVDEAEEDKETAGEEEEEEDSEEEDEKVNTQS